MEKKKIIFAGLDNGGKTSIILILQKKFSFMNSKPTQGVNRTSITETKCLGLEFVAWDMGGQAKYREEYIKQRYRMFSAVASMFYVIDIQDSERFEESIEYYRNIMQTYEDLQEFPKIIICFHKFDPDIIDNKEYQQKVEELKQKIKSINNDVQIQFHNTSIHDLSTIITSFSEGIVKGSPKEQLISDLLKDYAKATYSSAVILMDENTLIIGSHYTKKQYLEICQAVAPQFLSAMERICRYHLVPTNAIVEVKFSENNEEICGEGDLEAMVFVRSFKTKEDLTFNIITLSRNKNTFKLTDKFLPELADQLSELMHVMIN